MKPARDAGSEHSSNIGAGCTKDAALGLARGTVRLVPHQTAWEHEARAAIELLGRLWGADAVDIQHVGSTAVAGICAKPIVDIAVGVRDLACVDARIPLLEAQGFSFRGQDHPGQFLFVKGDAAQTMRTHHVHVVPWGGTIWTRYLAFRDYLIGHPDAMRAYNDLKQRLAQAYPDDRHAYTAAKRSFIEQILAAAEQRG